jgi:NADH-quinone oxidoreductase subunit N
MTVEGMLALLPLILLAVGALLIMLLIAFHRSHAVTAAITIIVFLLALASIPFAVGHAGPVTPLLILDGYASLVIGLVDVTGLLVALLSYSYLRSRGGRVEEFYLLLLTASLGAGVLAASSHFASFFLGLEILSISLYALIGYTYDNPVSVEASMKYLILAGSSSAFLLFGMALVYAETGSLEFARIASASTAPAGTAAAVMLLVGFVFMLVGFGFKLALVPFHLWTPDVYEGAPAPVSALVATVSKGSMFALLLRFFTPFDTVHQPALFAVFSIIAVASMLVGSLAALLQNNLKRLLAYSSIANLGYLLVAFLAGGRNAITASTFFLAAYFVSVLAAFGAVAQLSGGQQDAAGLDAYRGLMWRRPWLAAVLTAAMFSLAGIPLTAGFVGKFYVALAGVGSALWLLVLVLVISSAISLFYYLRVIVRMFSPVEGAPGPAVAAVRPPAVLALAALLVLLLWLGVYPTPVIQLIQSIAAR